MRKILLGFIFMLIVISPCFSAISGLQATVDKDIVKIGADAVVPASTIVKNVVSINGNISVHGLVQEDAVAIGGNVVLGDKAKIIGDVVSIGGKIKKDKGATIVGSETEVGLGKMSGFPTFITYKNIIWVGALIKILSFLAMLGLALFVVSLFPLNIGKISYYAERSAWKSFFFGVLASLLVIPVLILLVLSIIGIIFIPLYVMLIAAACFFGVIALSQLIGKKFFKALRLYNKPMMLEVLCGILILSLIDLIPVVGIIIKGIICLIGFGAVVATRFGSRD